MARSLQFRGGEIPEGGGEGQITRDLARGGANPWGGAKSLRHRDQIIYVGMIGLASLLDTRLLGNSEACSPGKNFNFEIFKLLEML